MALTFTRSAATVTRVMIIRLGRTYYTLPVRLIGGGVLGVALLAGLLTTFYTVEAESQGIVLRFGRYVHTVEPGLRIRLPYGIDRVYRVPVRRQLKQEFGFGTPGATNPYQYADAREQELERSMVTGDLNAATVEWVVQFRITDPLAYLFHFRDPGGTLRDVSESVMREVVGDRTVDEVITVGRQDIETESLTRLKSVVEQYRLGISIDQIQLKNVNPPPPVQPSFNEVNQAQQEREKSINVARGEYNKAVPRARGTAEERIRTAEGYAVRRVNEAQGDASRFTALFTEYTKAPEVTRQRLYLETLEEILPRLKGKIVLDEAARQVLPLLQLSPGKEAR
jgi:membrane protease subunit HflK